VQSGALQASIVSGYSQRAFIIPEEGVEEEGVEVEELEVEVAAEEAMTWPPPAAPPAPPPPPPYAFILSSISSSLPKIAR